MGTFKITGGKKLGGTITPQGAKNETLQILCAVLLTPEEVRITNIPDIVDVNKLIDLLGDLGVYVKKNGQGDYTFKAENVNLDYLTSDTFKQKGASLRGSIMIVGPLSSQARRALPTSESKSPFQICGILYFTASCGAGW